VTRGQHPPLVELSEVRDGSAPDDVVEHVETCDTCRERVVALSDFAGVAGDVGAIQGELPAEITTAFGRSETLEPARGQIWRCVWDENAVMALVWMVGDGDLTLMPVSFDTHLADQLTLVVDASLSGLGLPVGVWTALETGASTAVLERCLSELGQEELQAAAALRAARGGELPGGVSRGVRPGSRVDDRAQFRAELGAALRSLAETASWEPDDRIGMSLVEILNDAGIGPREVSQRLGLETRDVLALFQARRNPTGEELLRLDELAAEAGASYLPSTAARTSPPEELVARMNTPRWKPRLVGATAAWGCDEATVRRRSADEARQMSVAARRDRSADVDWDEFLDRVLP
jgi:hypothetical protein